MFRHTIVHQAGIRLILSLGLFVILIAMTSTGIYRAALQKASHERVEDLVTFYKGRLAQLERDWEIQSRDFKVRIEFTRILEQISTATSRLQAFITIQGTDRRFQYLIIETRQGEKIFDYGKDIALENIPHIEQGHIGHYFDPKSRQLYRIFEEKIWLGSNYGMGRFAVFYRIDNALLRLLSSPEITLSLKHDGETIASSGGQIAINDLYKSESSSKLEVREFPWSIIDKNDILLHIQAPVKTLFTTTELTIGMSAIPIVDALILWFTIGIWLMRQTRRITELGGAVDEFSTHQKTTDMLDNKLNNARLNKKDEIAEVADAIGSMVQAIHLREQERESITEQLRISEAHIRLITAALADGVVVIDNTGVIDFVNHQAIKLLGWEEMELLGKDSHHTFHYRTPDNDCVPIEKCLVHKSIADGVSYQSELDWFVKKNGEFLPVSLVATPIYKDEILSGAVITFQDITERLESQKVILESELRFRTLFNSSGDAILVHPLIGADGQFGTFVEVNDVACQRLGYSREELYTMTPLDLDEPGTFPSLEEIHAFQQQVQEQSHILFERVHISRTGLKIPVEISSHFFILNDEKMLLSIVRDISDRKQAEAEYKTILQTSHDGFWVVSATNARFLDVNPAYCQMVGYSYDELLTMTLTDVEATEGVEETSHHMEAIISGQEERFETIHRHKDGYLINVEVSAKYIEVRGGGLCCLCT